MSGRTPASTVPEFDAAARDPLALDVVIVGGTREARAETAARLHQHSHRRDRPFVRLDCTGLTTKAFVAALWVADGGTIHLDETVLAELPVQALVTKAVLGHDLGTELRRMVRPRFIAGTAGHDDHENDLARAAAEGRFRADLFHRLRGHTVKL